MKTNIRTVVICPEDEANEQVVNHSQGIELPIRTEDGQLMTNRLCRLLRDYGDRLYVPSLLVLDILRDRNQKSSQLKDDEQLLDDYDVCYAEAVGLLHEVCSAAETLVDKIIETCRDTELLGGLTAELEAFNGSIDEASGFLAEIVGDSECDCASEDEN